MFKFFGYEAFGYILNMRVAGLYKAKYPHVPSLWLILARCFIDGVGYITKTLLDFITQETDDT